MMSLPLQIFEQLCQTYLYGHGSSQADQRLPQRGDLLLEAFLLLDSSYECV
jgi:hypothetical protein